MPLNPDYLASLLNMHSSIHSKNSVHFYWSPGVHGFFNWSLPIVTVRQNSIKKFETVAKSPVEIILDKLLQVLKVVLNSHSIAKAYHNNHLSCVVRVCNTFGTCSTEYSKLQSVSFIYHHLHDTDAQQREDRS